MRKTRKKQKAISKPKNLSIEEQELSLRAERAVQTPFEIGVIEQEYFPFTNYNVTSDSKVRYQVEIRSLQDKMNSCGCPDYRVNTLGTCKHIVGVLNFIKSKGKREFNRLAKIGSSRTEIFLDPHVNEARVQWPQGDEKNRKEILSWISPYISLNQTHVVNPVMGVASIENALSGAPEEIASKIRLSQILIDWKQEKLLMKRGEQDRQEFLADVQAGKRSTQMLTCQLFPYQEQGMLHLAFQGRAILADEMGLGKTIQAIAACELLRRMNRAQRILVVTPASLKGEWQEQIAKFVGLPTLIVQGSRSERLASYQNEAVFYLVNYEQVRSDYAEIQELLNPDIVVLDEAQRIKNWQTKTAWAVKQLKSPYAFVLTGTPIENRIDELYSIMQFVNPSIFGPLFKFQRDFYGYDDKGKAVKYINLDKLHKKLDPIVLRRRKKDVEEQLPERVVSNYLIKMSSEQRVRYDEYSNQVARLLVILKKRPLAPEESKKLQRLLACMRMVADTPYILDEECRECPKLEELAEILQGLMEDGDCKVIIFSEWERMLFLVRELVEELGLNYAWHTGSVPQIKRREDINRFKEDPNCRLFLTTDSGSTGLNLQVANVVINLDLPWNPAKLEQRIARAWRKFQSRTVQVINLVTEDSIEQRMLLTLAMKQAVADAVLDADGEEDLDEMPLPSASREDFIAKLEQLTGQASTYKITPSPENGYQSHERMKEEALARHSDRIHLLEAYPNIVLAVVDKSDPDIKQSLISVSESPVEILDFETYQTMKRLVEAGIMHFGNDEKSVLYRSHLVQAEWQDAQRKKLEQAKAAYSEAERKLKMVVLLKSGCFSSEAMPAACEAFQKGMEALQVLEYTPDAASLALKEQLTVPQDPDAHIDALAIWMNNLSATIAAYALGIDDSSFSMIKEK